MGQVATETKKFLKILAISNKTKPSKLFQSHISFLCLHNLHFMLGGSVCLESQGQASNFVSCPQKIKSSLKTPKVLIDYYRKLNLF